VKAQNSSLLISVIIPTHNAAKFIGQCLESVLAQEKAELEIIVVDDGSTDDTARLVRENFPQVNYFYQDQAGAATARNKGLAVATGQFIAFLDADDLWCDEKLEIQLKILEQNKSVDLVFSDVNEFSHESFVADAKLTPLGVPKRGYSPITMLARANVFSQIGNFNTELSRGEFIDWFNRANDADIKSVLIEKVLAWRRVHEVNRAKYGQTANNDYARVARAAIIRRRQAAPVVLFVFNREHVTRTMIAALREAQVPRLYVVADGPRDGIAGDISSVAATRAVLKEIDWPCQLEVLSSEQNLGIKASYERGLASVFEQEQEAIILEDDCIPNSTFFRFCNELLQRYRSDEKVLQISGMSLNDRPPAPSNTSYHFSRYPLCWGWATWRRSWNLYDASMSAWGGELDRKWLSDFFETRQAIDYWDYLFSKNKDSLEHWDYCWMLACWKAAGFAIHPNRNLISNIGFDQQSTHTKDARSIFARLATTAMTFPLTHPDEITVNAEHDAVIELKLYSGALQALFGHVRNNLRRVVGI